MAEKGKKIFDRSKPHVNIGGIGHVDHGKTTLIAAITKHLAGKGQTKFKDYGEIDKAPEEKKRGITISTSHVEFETDDRTIETDDKKTIKITGRHYTWIDCPGHEDYIKNMITGAAQMDGAILILSAEDGAMNQTKEHLLLAKQIGIKHLVVFINKVDIILDLEQIELVREEIKGELEKVGYDAENVPIIGGSALCALEGRNPEIGEKAIADLLNAIDNYIPIPERDENANFLMTIEDTFTITGRGTVVTGSVEQGKLRKGEEVEISGLGMDSIKTVAVSIEMHNKELDEARPGDSAAINLRGVKREQVVRGQVLTKPSEKGKIKVTDKFRARVYILTSEERGRHTSFKSGYRPQFYFGATDVTGTITLTNKDEVVEPGSTVDFTVELAKPVAIEEKKNFVIRESNHTIGQGTIIEII